MQIVVDISDGVYGLLKYFEKVLGLNDKKDNNDNVKTALMRAVMNGTPLPKGHGRLIDAERYRKEMLDSREFDFFKTLDMQPTIIEADKESEE